MSLQLVTIPIVGSVLCEGEPMQPGSRARLYLDTVATPGLPDYVLAVTQMPASAISINGGPDCAGVPGVLYTFQYEDCDLLGVIPSLLPDHISSIKCTSGWDDMDERVVVLERDTITWRRDLTGLVGGLKTDLDYADVECVDVGEKVQLRVGNSDHQYELQASEKVPNSPLVIRPIGYADLTVKKIWILTHMVSVPSWRRELTGLLGGATTDLDFIDVDNLDTGDLVRLQFGDSHYQYELRESTEATNSPLTIRPADYAALAVKKVWVLTSWVSDVIPGELHVSPDAATATDVRTGFSTYDAAIPFKTIQTAIDAAAASGDSICLHGTGYVESLNVTDKSISFIAVEGLTSVSGTLTATNAASEDLTFFGVRLFSSTGIPLVQAGAEGAVTLRAGSSLEATGAFVAFTQASATHTLVCKEGFISTGAATSVVGTVTIDDNSHVFGDYLPPGTMVLEAGAAYHGVVPPIMLNFEYHVTNYFWEIQTPTVIPMFSGDGVFVDLVHLKDRDVYARVIYSDTHSEETLDAGVTVDSVLLKDRDVTARVIYSDTHSEETLDAGVTVDSVLLKDRDVTARVIYSDTHSEETLDAGVTTDGVLNKDGTVGLGASNEGVIAATNVTAPRVQEMQDASGALELTRTFATSAPPTGTTVAVAGTVQDHTEEINPIGTIAALTFELPASARVGLRVSYTSRDIVTALTVQVTGLPGYWSVAGAPAALAVNDFGTFEHLGSDQWVRVG